MADVGNWASFCEIFLFPGEARNPKVDGFKHTHTHTHTHIGIQVKVFKNIVQSRHKVIAEWLMKPTVCGLNHRVT